MSLGSFRDKQDECIDFVLGVAHTILETGKDALDLAPIPGLKEAAGALSIVIDMILKTKGNKKAWKELSKEIRSLSETIIELGKKFGIAMDQSQPSNHDEVRTQLGMTSEYKERVDALLKTLNEIAEEISALSRPNTFVRFLQSTRDEQTLKGLADRVRTARGNFIAGSVFTVERIVAVIAWSLEQMRLNMIHEEDAKMLRASPIAEASYKSIHAETKSHYLAGTRTDLLKELEKWASADAEFPMSPYTSLAA
ncbi:hypothetical protein QCA50_009715 [Cerrena zonata]|uniref:Fungal N-terminal domain-containing protein n=1 Tax=Cerrena zonata TaxID=2478898 RepID=A0AAW0G164_9APHY